MRVQRFIAADIRSALRDVRAELGAEAVILSNRKIDGMVEILAARDYDEALINEALSDQRIQGKPDSAAAYYENAARKEAAEAPALTERFNSDSNATLKNNPSLSYSTTQQVTTASAMNSVTPMASDPGITQMRDELHHLHRC